MLKDNNIFLFTTILQLVLTMMSFLKGLFGGSSSKSPVPDANHGLQQLEEKAEMMRKKIAHLSNQIQTQENLARKYATTDKAKALSALKQKKKYEEQLRVSEGTLDNLENQKDMLENASSNAAVLKTMAETARIVKKEHEKLDINKIEDIVDEVREQKELSEEIANILSQNTTKVADDDELLKELASLEQEQLDAKLLQTDKDTAILPDVPTQVPAQPAASKAPKKVEDEFEDLKKWASASSAQ